MSFQFIWSGETGLTGDEQVILHDWNSGLTAISPTFAGTGQNKYGGTARCTLWRGGNSSIIGCSFADTSTVAFLLQHNVGSEGTGVSAGLVHFREDATSNVQIVWTQEDTYAIVVSGSGVASMTVSVGSATWHTLCGRLYLSQGTDGQVELYVSGEEVLSWTGVTAATGVTAINRIGYGDVGLAFGDDNTTQGFAVWTDDAPASFFGSQARCMSFRPFVTAEVESDWVPSTGGNGSCVDDSETIDDDGSFVSSDTVGERDSYEVQPQSALSAGDVPYGAMIRVVTRGSGGTDALSIFAIYSSFESGYTSAVSASTSYEALRFMLHSAPGDPGWSKQSQIVSALVGIEHE